MNNLKFIILTLISTIMSESIKEPEYNLLYDNNISSGGGKYTKKQKSKKNINKQYFTKKRINRIINNI